MERNERQREMSPAERRRRMEARRKRQKERERKKRIRLMLIIGMAVAALVVIGLIIFAVTRIVSGGSKEITSKSGTFVIAIDAGHGGEDIGMSNGDTLEKNVTLDISSKLKVMLEEQLGYQVIMLREEDLRISKEERIQTINESEADLLISIHCGYSEDSTLSGAISYYKIDSKPSEDLANLIQKDLMEVSGITNSSFQEGDFNITSDTEIPAVLIEVGYLSNAEEAVNLADDKYQSTIARGIATAVRDKLGDNQ